MTAPAAAPVRPPTAAPMTAPAGPPVAPTAPPDTQHKPLCSTGCLAASNPDHIIKYTKYSAAR